MSAALAWCLEQQLWARDEYTAGNPMAFLGISDLVAEEVLIRFEEEATPIDD